MRGGGRRGLRAEIEARWTCFDAVRPIRKEDMQDSAEPPPPASTAIDANRAPEPDGGTT